ncbi:synaptotagmin-C-like [Periplaneta americana]|uniref:synaptotagmin-C-like n=1 Tax=Periplaneta americana TaxID=6978 RepID=UPI0037E72005
MAVSAITSIKNIIGYKGSTRKGSETSVKRDDSLDPVPTVGFRVGYTKGTTKLEVRVLGARHLPAKVGRTAAGGYTVKVKLFPGREKFETETKPESWPVYNQDFSFEIANCPIVKKGTPLEAILSASNFLVFTIYAEDASKKKRVIGAATWPLDHTQFTHKQLTHDYGDNEELETPDIWKRAKDISSGITGVKQKIEERNNQLEVSLCYTPRNAEEGEVDILTLGVSKLRWSLEATREYEQKKALLYVKLNLLENGGRSIKFSKTRRFPPSISVHFQPDKDNSILDVELPQNREDLRCEFSLCTKPMLGKKTVFGRVVLGPEVGGPGSDHWERAFESPTRTITHSHNLH